jgi:hypothetical protein
MATLLLMMERYLNLRFLFLFRWAMEMVLTSSAPPTRRLISVREYCLVADGVFEAVPVPEAEVDC